MGIISTVNFAESAEVINFVPSQQFHLNVVGMISSVAIEYKIPCWVTFILSRLQFKGS